MLTLSSEHHTVLQYTQLLLQQLDFCQIPKGQSCTGGRKKSFPSTGNKKVKDLKVRVRMVCFNNGKFITVAQES